MTVLRVSDHTARKTHSPCPDCGVSVVSGERYRRHVQVCFETREIESFARHIDCAEASIACREALEHDEGFYWWRDGLEMLADEAGSPSDQPSPLWYGRTICCESREVLGATLLYLFSRYPAVFMRIWVLCTPDRYPRVDAWMTAAEALAKARAKSEAGE